MEEIKVGEYVRTKQGYIAKCVEVDEDGYYYTFDEFVQESYGDKYDSLYKRELKEIVKHSSNIIDLIEVGDYVNGSEVVAEKYTNYDMDFINVDSEISFGWGYGVIPENDIKSIVTKEQFANAEYKVKE